MTPTKQEMIDKIYEVIADKTRNMWCKIWRYEDEYSKELTIWTYINSYVPNEYTCNPRIKLFNWKIIIWDWEYEYETIGNPVMIGDCLDWYCKLHPVEMEIKTDLYWKHTFIYSDLNWVNINSIWEFPRLPIESQSEECIRFIYSLIS
jgi:hypothetical protein